MLSQRYCQGKTLNKEEQMALSEWVEEWRNRLMGISWFMRDANKLIADEANREDRMTEHFWEGQFKYHTKLPYSG